VGLPARTHNILLSSISCRPPLLDEIAKTFISNIQGCLSCDSGVIKFVTSYGITVGTWHLQLDSMLCSVVANLAFVYLIFLLCHHSLVYASLFCRSDPHVVAVARAVLELIFVRNDSMSLSLGLDFDDVIIIIIIIIISFNIS